MKSIVICTLFVCSAFVAVCQDTTGQEYVGRYKFAEGSVVPDVTVAIENGALTMNSLQGGSPLKMLGVDSFAIPNFQGIAVFKRNSEKKVSAVHIEAQGYLLDGTKDPAQLAIARKEQDLLSRKDRP